MKNDIEETVKRMNEAIRISTCPIPREYHNVEKNIERLLVIYRLKNVQRLTDKEVIKELKKSYLYSMLDDDLMQLLINSAYEMIDKLEEESF